MNYLKPIQLKNNPNNKEKFLSIFSRPYKMTFYDLTKSSLLRNKLNNMFQGRINDLTVNLNVYLYLLKAILEKDKSKLDDINIKKCLVLMYKTTRNLDLLKAMFHDISQDTIFNSVSYENLKKNLVKLELNAMILKNLL